MSRIPRGREELKRNIADTIDAGRLTAFHFDHGNPDVRRLTSRLLANQIALLVVTRGQTAKGLLTQADRLSRLRFPSTGPRFDPRNLLGHQQLVGVMLPEGTYYPHCWIPENPGHKTHFVWFDDWWHEPVIVKEGVSITREDIVLEVRDTDGGSHFDEKLEESYAMLSRRNALGWELIDGDPPIRRPVPMGDPVPASLRQIWWELDQAVTSGRSSAA